MVRENRIKTYDFPIGSLTADGNKNINVYSHYPLNGTIQKVQLVAGNWNAVGSIWLFESGGAAETILYQSGACATTQTFYPFKYGQLAGATASVGSPMATRPIVLNTNVRFVASGLDAGTSGLGLSIFYI
jgi:hypothetical protein